MFTCQMFLESINQTCGYLANSLWTCLVRSSFATSKGSQTTLSPKNLTHLLVVRLIQIHLLHLSLQSLRLIAFATIRISANHFFLTECCNAPCAKTTDTFRCAKHLYQACNTQFNATIFYCRKVSAFLHIFMLSVIVYHLE